MSNTVAVYRNFTLLLHERVGQITSEEMGGWNVKAGRFNTIQSYTRLKRELKSFSYEGPRVTGPRGIRAFQVVFEAIVAGVECGQLNVGNCYSTVFKDRRDWNRFATDFGHKNHSVYWINERYHYALDHLEMLVPDRFHEIAAELLAHLRSWPIREESLAVD